MRGMQRAFHWLRPTSRVWRWVLGVAIAAILLAYAFAFLTGEALRRYVEREVNHRLTGYTARIGTLEIHPLLGSFELRNSIISQDANPNPPVASIDRLRTTLDWRALRHGRVVADILFERPKIHVDLTQVQTEATNSRDAPASFREKLYEGLVDVSAKVLKNRPRREIVTVMDVSGRVDQPQIRTWQVVRGLLRNAFIEAVYPGFERDEGRTAKLKPAPAIR
jgi:hypothetical protein